MVQKLFLISLILSYMFTVKAQDVDIKQFKEPYYLVELDWKDCLYEIKVNDIPISSTEEITTGYIFASINEYIPQSDLQDLTVLMYPIDGEQQLRPTATLEVKITVFDKSTEDRKEYTVLSVDKIDQNANAIKKGNGFTLNIPFEAYVPYKTANWKVGKDLSKIPDLEDRLLQTYFDLHDVISKRDSATFNERIKEFERRHIQSAYHTNKSINTENLFSSLMMNPDYTAIPIPYNFDLHIFGNNRIAQLVGKSNDPMIGIQKLEENSSSLTYVNIWFYIPEDSDELTIL